MSYTTERKLNAIQVNKNKRWGTDIKTEMQTFTAIIGPFNNFDLLYNVISCPEIQAGLQRKEHYSACILSKLMMTSRKLCYCRKMQETTCNKRASDLFMPFWFGTQIASLPRFWGIQTKLFYHQSLVCTDLRICYFCDSCYRNLNLQGYIPSKIRSCTMHLQYCNLSLRL